MLRLMAYLLEWFASLSSPPLQRPVRDVRAVHVGVPVMHLYSCIMACACHCHTVYNSSTALQQTTCSASIFRLATARRLRVHLYRHGVSVVRPTSLQAYKEARTQHWPQGTTLAENLCGFKEGLAEPVISVSSTPSSQMSDSPGTLKKNHDGLQ